MLLTLYEFNKLCSQPRNMQQSEVFSTLIMSNAIYRFSRFITSPKNIWEPRPEHRSYMLILT